MSDPRTILYNNQNFKQRVLMILPGREFSKSFWFRLFSVRRSRPRQPPKGWFEQIFPPRPMSLPWSLTHHGCSPQMALLWYFQDQWWKGKRSTGYHLRVPRLCYRTQSIAENGFRKRKSSSTLPLRWSSGLSLTRMELSPSGPQRKGSKPAKVPQ